MNKSLFKFIKILPAVFLLLFSFSCQKQVEEGITEVEAQEIADHVLEIWNVGNLDLVDHTYAPDYVRHYVDIYPDIEGIDAYKKWITDTRTTFPDFNVTITDEPIIQGEMIVSRFVFTGTHTGPLNSPAGTLPPTGKKVRASGVTINHVIDGKIVEEWLYFNQASTLQQLGFTLVPPAPPSPEKK